MIVTDPIADMLNRVRNAGSAAQKSTVMPFSALKGEVAAILQREGYIRGVSIEDDGGSKVLRLELKYDADRKPAIRGLRRVSKPGLRQYVGVAKIPRVLGGLGMAILSTPAGILTDREAREKKVGGEVLCKVW